MKADLHIHTKYSDGSFSVKEIIKLAKDKRIDVIAITDHDVVEAIHEIENNDINIIIGVELSTYHNGHSVHILGYFINNDVPNDIINILKKYADYRRKRVFKIVGKLKKYYDIEIDAKEILNNTDSIISRAHIASVICQKYNLSKKEVFDLYLGVDKKAYVATTQLKTIDAIKLLHDNNAIAIMAHPSLSKNVDIKDLILHGLDGIEVYHPDNTIVDCQKYLEIAKNYNILITGGSDFHNHEGIVKLGKYSIDENQLKIFLNKLNKKD